MFRRWITMVPDCPTCGLHFERLEGYWLGSVVINLAVTQGLFLALFVTLVVGTWPEVPWTTVLITLVTVNAVVPILFHPVSRTLWVALDRHVHARAHPDEETARAGYAPPP